MEFYTAYQTQGTTPSPTGDGFEPVFDYKVNNKGVKELVQTGKTNLYEKIQASAEYCEVYSILERFDNGDYSVLEKARGQFGDFTQFPKTLAERQQQLVDAEIMFDKLPLNVRKEFGNSFTQFLASFETGEYKDIFAKFGHAVEETPSAIDKLPTTLPTQETVQPTTPNFNPLQQGANINE